MNFYAEPSLLTFVFQSILATIYIPLSVIVFHLSRASLKEENVNLYMEQLGISKEARSQRKLVGEFTTRSFILPLITNMLVVFTMFSVVHPYPVERGWWSGILEEIINIFGNNSAFPKPIIAARMLYWGWSGAWIYSVHLIYRRVATYDLTPSVFIYSANRFLLAFVVGSIVGTFFGTYSNAAGMSFDMNLTTTSMVLFFIGFFPEQGITWITTTAKKALKQRGRSSKEILLSEIEGLSIWHQGRLAQKNIDNVQNLATTDLPNLVASTAFTAGQAVDWVDQAILLRYTNNRQMKDLEKAGIICASSFLLSSKNETDCKSLSEVSGLKVTEIKILREILKSATNMKIIMHFREKELK